MLNCYWVWKIKWICYCYIKNIVAKSNHTNDLELAGRARCLPNFFIYLWLKFGSAKYGVLLQNMITFVVRNGNVWALMMVESRDWETHLRECVWECACVEQWYLFNVFCFFRGFFITEWHFGGYWMGSGDLIWQRFIQGID